MQYLVFLYKSANINLISNFLYIKYPISLKFIIIDIDLTNQSYVFEVETIISSIFLTTRGFVKLLSIPFSFVIFRSS